MTTWLQLLLLVLAAYRLTRILTTDSISEAARDRLYHWAWIEQGEPGYEAAYLHARMLDQDTDGTQPLPRASWRTYVNELGNCPWCMGVWVSYALTAWWAWGWRDGMQVTVFLVTGLAVAGGQGFLASRRDA